MRQDELNDLLVELGRRGSSVVRLKGGDPFVFGRGGEEALALAEAGIPFEVVPGVSALSRRAGVGGDPVTHRGVSAQVTLVSGHSAYGDDLDYAHLAATPGTLVVFMGLAPLSGIAARLIEHGSSPRHPPRSSRAEHDRTAAPSAGELHEVAQLAEGLEQPALLVVGDVVGALAATAARAAA